jgi:short-subunit dehydrogenase
LLRELESKVGLVELLICNAGFGVFGRFSDARFTEWQHQLDALLTNTLDLVHTWVGAAKDRQHGFLVVMSSLAGEFPIPGFAAYSAAKAGLSAFLTALRHECYGLPIIIWDVRLGDVNTGFNNSTARPTRLDPGMERVWAVLESNLLRAPPPDDIARSLIARIRTQRGGVVRLGNWSQAWLFPFLTRFAPLRLQESLARRYFACGKVSDV